MPFMLLYFALCGNSEILISDVVLNFGPFQTIYCVLQIYPNMRSAFVDIVQTRGFTGLYAGLSPTLVEIIPYAGLQFGTYDTFKRWASVKFQPLSHFHFY